VNATALTPLVEATDPDTFGGKAAQLAAALGAGLPVPDGFAVAWPGVRALVTGDPSARDLLDDISDQGPWAVRSSAIGEDSAEASFAGTHLTVLGVVGTDAVRHAVHHVHDSVLDEGAAAYRRQHGLDPTPRMAVVLQPMIASEVAGVLFTRNPVTGATERVVEASWGLGETVVSGLVSPDQYRLAADDGRLLDRRAGEKDLAMHLQPDGTVAETEVDPALVEAWCLGDRHLLDLHHLAGRCDHVFGTTEHDIEFAFAGDRLHLLQRRPITHG
jgi:pyruvate, water dikinase